VLIFCPDLPWYLSAITPSTSRLTCFCTCNLAVSRCHPVHTLLIASFTVFPITLAAGQEPLVLTILIIIVLVPIIVFFAWVELYYKSVWYELREDEMSWKRGVWFQTTGIVPHNRITNLDVKQGPVMRALGISTLAIQTAGYSGQVVPEIRIEGMEHAEELRDLIRSLVRQTGTQGDGTGSAPEKPKSTGQKILEELMKIRQILEEERT
jgi:uncharacterized protein